MKLSCVKMFSWAAAICGVSLLAVGDGYAAPKAKPKPKPAMATLEQGIPGGNGGTAGSEDCNLACDVPHFCSPSGDCVEFVALDGTCTSCYQFIQACGDTTDCGADGSCPDGSFCATTCCPQPECYPLCTSAGACCLDSGCSQISDDDCASMGGLYRGHGSTCTDSGICNTGACCTTNGGCEPATEAECLAQNGLYSGDGTDCGDMGICPPGACCSTNSCFVTTEAQCIDFNATYQGPGSTCADCFCGPPNTQDCCVANTTDFPGCADDSCCSAVCAIDDYCCGVFQAGRGPTGHGHWDAQCAAEAAMLCAQCMTGACCTGDTCVVMSAADCAAAGGLYGGDLTNCDLPAVACCAEGTCEDRVPVCCLAQGGTPGGGSCSYTQACCMPDGSCTEIKPSCCTLNGGTPGGHGTTCQVEACCMGLECQDMAPSCCAQSNGTPLGVGTQCGVAVAGFEGVDVRACCLPTGACEMADVACCTYQGGTPGEVGSTCDPEACCTANPGCTDVAPVCCAVMAGTSQGAGSVCSTDEACCLPGGTCVNMDPLCCDDAGGTAQGSGTLCTAPEACCFSNGTCEYLDPVCCAGAGGTPEGLSTICSTTTACCLPDGCQMLDILCCEDLGGISIAGAACSAAVEACCLPDGSCADLDPACCTLQMGTPHGAGTVCTGAQACCTSDVCTDRDPLCCAAAGGMSDGAGTACAIPEACCFSGGTCQNIDPSCCDNAGGTPAGTALECAAPAITCPDDVTIECDEPTVPSNTGTATATDDCTPGLMPTYTDEIIPSMECAQEYTITRHWTVTDADGNTSPCDQTITVVDTTAPDVECREELVVAICESSDGVPSEDVEIGARASDNCEGASTCCYASGGLGCDNNSCEQDVCAQFPECCVSGWNSFCAAAAQELCGNLCAGESDCCFADFSGPGCEDDACEAAVCALNPDCCTVGWGVSCGNRAAQICGNLCQGGRLPVMDDRPSTFPPTCDGPGTVVTFSATDSCGNVGTCETRVRVIGGMCCPAETDTDLKLMITDLDLRQDHEGPPKTKARFDIWNSNEVRFSGTERCITCWDETLISLYGPIANHFLLDNLQTDKGKARIHDDASTVCPESEEHPLLGVAIKETRFLGSPHVQMRSAVTLVGVGEQEAVIRYDIIAEPDEANGGNGLTITQVPSTGTGLDPILNTDTNPLGGVSDNRASTTFKGSLIIWPVIEVKWDRYGNLIQDTFIQLLNDTAGEVKVQLYQVNGDAPLDAVIDQVTHQIIERAHPGWNNTDYQITLTGDQSIYWSVATGYPAGVSPITVLDPGNPNGRPDLDASNPGGRVIRGFLVGWAVNDDGHEIRWNHLKGHAVSLRYDEATAYDYNPWSFRVVSGVPEGAESDDVPGQLLLDGMEYDLAPDSLLFDFFAAGSRALSHPNVRD